MSYVVEIFRLRTLNTPVAGMTIPWVLLPWCETGPFWRMSSQGGDNCHTLGDDNHVLLRRQTVATGLKEFGWDLAHLCGFVNSSAPEKGSHSIDFLSLSLASHLNGASLQESQLFSAWVANLTCFGAYILSMWDTTGPTKWGISWSLVFNHPILLGSNFWQSRPQEEIHSCLKQLLSLTPVENRDGEDSSEWEKSLVDPVAQRVCWVAALPVACAWCSWLNQKLENCATGWEMVEMSRSWGWAPSCMWWCTGGSWLPLCASKWGKRFSGHVKTMMWPELQNQV